MAAKPRNFLAIGLLLIIVFFGFATGAFPPGSRAHADSDHNISLYVDGQSHVFTSADKTVGEVLADSHVTLGQGDLVEPSAGTVISDGNFNINVYRARPVLVVDGLRSYHFSSAYQSPRLLAQAAGLTVYPEDDYDTGVVTNFVDSTAIGVKVTVKRAVPFVLTADGATRTIRTQGKTVSAALTDAKLPLGISDTVSVPLDTVITPNLDVTVTRVTEAVTTVNEPLVRPQQTVNDPTMLKGQTKVQSDGSDGQRVVTYRIHYRDGVETSRDVVKLISQTDPTPRVVLIGTKVLFAGSVEYWRPMVEAAATQWGLDPNTMLRIMACESGGNATSVSHFVVDGQHPTGLFQYLPTTWIAAGGTSDNILDGAVQIQLTARKMATQGTGAWQCK